MRSVAVSAAALAACAGMAHGQLLEGFDNLAGLAAQGWTIQNASTPPVLDPAWFQGNPAVWPAFSGAPEAYAASNWARTQGTTGTETISTWMVTPVITVNNGDNVSFYTRTYSPPTYPDRMQVRMSTAGTGSVVPTTPTDVGTFTTLLLDINPNYSLSGYPDSWTLMTAPISGLAGPTQVRIAFRYFVENAGPAGINSDFIGVDDLQIGSNIVTGACCQTAGTCVITTASVCASQGGTYRGDNSVCATANCPLPPGVWIEQADAGDMPNTAQVTQGTGALNEIRGQHGANDADMFAINICSPASFSASTVNGTTIDTQLFLFRADGMGVSFNDDSTGLQSTLTSMFTSSLPAGQFYLALSQYDMDPFSAGGDIWIDTPFAVERAPDGPGAASPITGWTASGTTAGAYTIFLTGSCFAQGGGSACYANCDASTTVPFLNVADFGCFLSKFAASDPYANCDGSTQPPVLNVADFGCFLSKFAAGCSAP